MKCVEQGDEIKTTCTYRTTGKTTLTFGGESTYNEVSENSLFFKRILNSAKRISNSDLFVLRCGKPKAENENLASKWFKSTLFYLKSMDFLIYYPRSEDFKGCMSFPRQSGLYKMLQEFTK